MKTKASLILFVLFVLAYGAPFLIGYLNEKPLTDEVRAKLAPGKIVGIEHGAIHYLDRGPEDGPVIVMVHGFATPHFIFEQNAQALIAEGFRVIQFDHFGRGWSDRPNVKYDATFYDRELLQILDALELTNPVGLVGVSMGGAIATEFLANHSSRVSRLFLIVPAGLEHSRNPNSLASRIITTPILGDWFWRLSARYTIIKGREERARELAEENRLQGDVTEQMNYRGYFPALLSTYRNFPLRDRDESFGRAAETGVSIAAIFGGADPIIPIESADRFNSALPDAQVSVIADGTHGLNYENSETINPILVDFFLD